MKHPRKTHRRRGAAIVETALVLPIFFGVVFGIVEFGRAMMVGQLVTNAAREATRRAIIEGTTNDDIETFVEEFLVSTAGVEAGDISVSISIEPAEDNDDPGGELANAHSNDLIEIMVSIPADKASFLPNKWLKGKSLAGRASMRHE